VLSTGLSSAASSPIGETLALTFAAGLGGAAVFVLLLGGLIRVLRRHGAA
jgi:hypothetical protein